MKKLIFVLILVLGFAANSRAACTGSGTTWSCPAAATSSDIASAISAGTSPIVITFTAGNYSGWTTITAPAAKSVTLICATAPPADPAPFTMGGNGAATSGGCNLSLTVSNPFTAPYNGAVNNNLYRFSGFNVTTTSAGNFTYLCPGGNCTGSFTKWRFDHNTFNMPDGATLFFPGDCNSVGLHVYGVIDHNVFNSTGMLRLVDTCGRVDFTDTVTPFGTGNNLFIENNTVNNAAMTAPESGAGCTDGWGDTSNFVLRWNIFTNCRILTHGVIHDGGPLNVEAYMNKVVMDAGSVPSGLQDCYHCIHHQGSGSFIAIGNLLQAFSGKNGSAIGFLHYRDDSSRTGNSPCDGTRVNATDFSGGTFTDGNRTPTTTWYGYPCWRQPGRDPSGRIYPLVAIKNTWADTGAKVDMSFDGPGASTPVPPSCTAGPGGTCQYSSFHIQPNRDYYNAVSVNAQSSTTAPFDGSTGAGFGTFLNRPAHCTPNATEAGSGPMYLATDVGTNPGTIYECTATDTWTAYWTPYTYPHPLVALGGPPPAKVIGNGTISGAATVKVQ